MNFTFNCPYCEQPLDAAEEWIGMEAECPACGQKITVKKDEELKVFNLQEPGARNSNVKKDEEILSNISHMANDSKLKAVFRTIRNLFSSQTIRNLFSSRIVRKIVSNLIWFLAAVVIVGLVVSYLKYYPRAAFWTLAPISGLIVFGWHDKMHKFLTMVICVGIIFWGWEVNYQYYHSKSDYRNNSESSHRSTQDSDDKISITVRVEKWYYSPGDVWKYNCEYKLYADDECIATKNSTSMSVSFNVRVKKGANLRGEMLPKNGFGGIASTYEGPLSWKPKITASYSGQKIIIQCY